MNLTLRENAKSQNTVFSGNSKKFVSFRKNKMMRLKQKNAGPDSPFIPDSGSRKSTAIKREMTTGRSGKMDTANMILDLGDDQKHLRSEVKRSQDPKNNVNLASDIVHDPDELEPTSRKVRTRQYVVPDVGIETQIKLRSAHAAKSRRKSIRLHHVKLDDVNTTFIVDAPKLQSGKQTTRPVQIDLGDTRDLPSQNMIIPTLKPKIQTPGHQNTEISDEHETVSHPYNPLKTVKGGANIPFALSSGFNCDFNPIFPEHRAKLKKAFSKVKVVIQQDSEVGVSVVSNIKFKTKKHTIVKHPDVEDTHNASVNHQLRKKGEKKHRDVKKDVDTFDNIDVQLPIRTKHKTSSTKSFDINAHENVEIADRKSHSSKRSHLKSNVDVGDDHRMDVKASISSMKDKNTILTNTDIPEDQVYIELGQIKGTTKVKKTKGRMPVLVQPFDGEVTVSAKPLDPVKKKDTGESNSLGNINGGEVVQVSETKKSKPQKKSERVELELGPDDKVTDSLILEPIRKSKPARPELPQFEPTRDNQDVEIEKNKNVLIFT
jgi:hypothetical protein